MSLLSCQNNKGRLISTADRHIKLFLKHVLVEKGIKGEDLASRRNKLRLTYKYMTPYFEEYCIACLVLAKPAARQWRAYQLMGTVTLDDSHSRSKCPRGMHPVSAESKHVNPGKLNPIPNQDFITQIQRSSCRYFHSVESKPLSRNSILHKLLDHSQHSKVLMGQSQAQASESFITKICPVIHAALLAKFQLHMHSGNSKLSEWRRCNTGIFD